MNHNNMVHINLNEIRNISWLQLEVEKDLNKLMYRV